MLSFTQGDPKMWSEPVSWAGWASSPPPPPCRALAVPGPPAQSPEEGVLESSAPPLLLTAALPQREWLLGRLYGGIHHPLTPTSHQAPEAGLPGPLPGRGDHLSGVLTPSH